ncbi:NADAR family protein [Pseudomonas aeruginosa]
MKVENGLTMFFTSGDAFSNWYIRDFVVKGVRFNCGEQAMMYAKAMLFGDRKVAEKILAEPDPKNQKALGKTCKFDQAIWDAKCVEIMSAILYHKFAQHKDLEELLLSTVGTELVEASPYDRVWGVGLSSDDPRIFDKKKWRGQNLLGQVLTNVRQRLLDRKISRVYDDSPSP